jgi:hypothetical protein
MIGEESMVKEVEQDTDLLYVTFRLELTPEMNIIEFYLK